MRIALDAMGTDHAPASEVAGAVQALTDTSDFEIVLVGDEAIIEAELSGHENVPRDRLAVVHAPDRVLPSDSASSVLRKKRNSSIAVGLGLQKSGDANAFISAGNTGAVMAGSLFILRTIPGVDRPAIGALIPTARGALLLVDAGANVDCKPHQLVQFAHLGKVYAQDLMGIADPRVGLLNIGEEAGKGDELATTTHALLSDEALNFVGNIEGRAIITGACDVLVCDGFAGNVLLKFYESVAQFIIGLLDDANGDTGSNQKMDEVRQILDWTEYGGAPLLGVNGISIICHGGSPPKAIRNAVGVAVRAVEAGMVSHLETELATAASEEEAS